MDQRSHSDSDAKTHAIIRGVWIAVIVVIATVAIGLLTTRVTASPVVCGSCHEMSAKVDTWRTSPHAQVGCPDCHEDPRPWYRFPETLAVRSAMLTRDVQDHFTDTEQAAASAEATSSIPDSRCLECHDPSREVTMRFGTLIDHDEHAERNGSCVSCHLWTGHPDPEAEKALLLMEQCFNCHGREETAQAPGTCDVCHPSDFEKRPLSHQPADWQDGHGELAKADESLCLMCHEESMCLDCHGVEMPHPEGWDEGASNHGPVAKQNRETCVQCHPRDPDFCTMCHHEGFVTEEGPWVDQHPELVTERGAAFCIDCHLPQYCYDCHTLQ